MCIFLQQICIPATCKKLPSLAIFYYLLLCLYYVLYIYYYVSIGNICKIGFGAFSFCSLLFLVWLLVCSLTQVLGFTATVHVGSIENLFFKWGVHLAS